MTSLIVTGLAVRLGGREVLREIDLTLEPGRFTVVVGPNGAGKTTLLRSLAGLLLPDRGTVTLNGENLRHMTGSSRAKAVAYLTQNGTVAWPMPVESVVALGRLPHGETPDALTPAGSAAVATAIASVGLRGFETRPATELSGGERARVLLARALAIRAPVLLVDEPVASLDPRHELVVLNVLKAHAAAGALVVAIMHNLTLAARFADEVVLLDRGRLKAHAGPAEVFTPERLAASFGIAARVTPSADGLVIVAERPLDAT